ncbi:MAG: hypothetical protein Kow0047_03260 [Anaerolineae bacterium]
MANSTDLVAVLNSYLEAIEARDLDRCMSFYTDDAVVHFGMGVYRGAKSITDWHRERFDADLHVLEMDRVEAGQDQVTCELVVTSRRLKAWRINTLRGKGTFTFRDGKIAEARFGLAGASALEGWR